MTPAPGTEMVVVTSVGQEAAPFRSRGIPVVVAGVGRVSGGRDRSRTRFPADAGHGRECRHRRRPAGRRRGPLPNGVVVYAIDLHGGGPALGRRVRPGGGLGFPLATFAEGNAIPADPRALELVRERLPDARFGPIATVATCSGTDALAEAVVERTAAIAEAMEGAAVLHAARLLGVASIEIRVVSNRCGRRDRQDWDLERAFAGLDEVAAALSST